MKVPSRTLPDGLHSALFFNIHNYMELNNALGAKVASHYELFFFLVRQIAYEYGGAYGQSFNSGIWAFFPSPQSALDAGLEVHRHLNRAYRDTPNLPRIQPTVSAAFGKLAFATVQGREMHMGNPIRLSKNVGMFLNEYGLKVLLTQGFLDALPESRKEETQFWWVDQILTDEQKVERVYEVCSLDTPTLRDFKCKSEWVLQEALVSYFTRNVPAALNQFDELIKDSEGYPELMSFLKHYQNRCQEYLSPTQFPYQVREHWDRAGV